MSSASIFQWQQFLSDVIINWLSTTTEDKCCMMTGTWLKHCHPFARPLSLLMNICTTYADKLRGGIYLSNVSAIERITWNRKINPYTTSTEDCAVVAQGADPADLSWDWFKMPDPFIAFVLHSASLQTVSDQSKSKPMWERPTARFHTHRLKTCTLPVSSLENQKRRWKKE